MCGYAFLQSEVNEYHERFASATKSLHHRGPDNQELFTIEDQSFFHARLSIIDVHERSNQPFRKHGLTLLYNGEIYNFLELRKIVEKILKLLLKTTLRYRGLSHHDLR